MDAVDGSPARNGPPAVHFHRHRTTASDAPKSSPASWSGASASPQVSAEPFSRTTTSTRYVNDVLYHVARYGGAPSMAPQRLRRRKPQLRAAVT
jgi:hypothetical protein